MTTRRTLLRSFASTALLVPTMGWAAGTPRITDFTLRRSEDRGTGMGDWLYSRHTFSFARYRDPDHMGFRSLRVINEDVVSARASSPCSPLATRRPTPSPCTRTPTSTHR